MGTTALDQAKRERALTRNRQTQTLILDLSWSRCVTLRKSFGTSTSVSPYLNNLRKSTIILESVTDPGNRVRSTMHTKQFERSVRN